MTTIRISLTQYCNVHQVEPEFIYALASEGLIRITSGAQDSFIGEEDLDRLERFTRWHAELGLNPAGIDTIGHLVEKIRTLQLELNELHARLRLYEGGDGPPSAV